MSVREFTRPPLGDFHTSPFYGRDIISAEDFSGPEVLQISDLATQIEQVQRNGGLTPLLVGKTACILFYEPSSRTQGSFKAAMIRLGGNYVDYPDPTVLSSVAKGESLEDTVRILDGQGDVTVIRHKQIGSAAIAAKYARNPVINGGDGHGEHPTQALLDIHTIRREQGEVDGKVITMMGDLRFGRTIHSLARMLTRFSGVSLNFVSPEGLDMPEGDIDFLKTRGLVKQRATRDINEVLPETDVLYVVRTQAERIHDPELVRAIEESKPLYAVTPETMEKAKPTMTLMHPLPRVGEIAPAVDNDPRAKYFDQAEYGVEVREALLALILGRAV